MKTTMQQINRQRKHQKDAVDTVFATSQANIEKNCYVIGHR